MLLRSGHWIGRWADRTDRESRATGEALELQSTSFVDRCRYQGKHQGCRTARHFLRYATRRAAQAAAAPAATPYASVLPEAAAKAAAAFTANAAVSRSLASLARPCGRGRRRRHGSACRWGGGGP